MNTNYGQAFYRFGILAVLIFVVVDHLSQQTVLTQLISATLVIMFCVVSIIDKIFEK